MSYQRYYTGNDWRDDGSHDGDRGRYQDRSSAREYRAAGMSGDEDRDDDGRSHRGYRGDRFGPYGERGYGGGYRGADQSGYGYGRSGYGSSGSGRSQYGNGGRNDHGDYDYQDRGFFNRAGDEVRSWFGDEEAERRRRLDQRYDEQHDPEYHGWRQRQIEALDRDYHDYRHERQQSFNQQFDSWRGERGRQRQSLTQVREHMDVVGSDGEHVGTVDKVRGDRIILTKSDPDAGGHHHSIPVGWIGSVDDKVTLTKTAEEAQRLWRDEERGALFGGGSSGHQDRSVATTGNRFGGY
ncbi:DUF2171 domain-containing protein [Sphingomonas sp. GlSt437]|uniref:DUF2171 domain-containing protein n=1 Tax=Sphingomonas sp. GlSt437 TaxID=3389970 RepID=UPI003A8BF8DB